MAHNGALMSASGHPPVMIAPPTGRTMPGACAGCVLFHRDCTLPPGRTMSGARALLFNDFVTFDHVFFLCTDHFVPNNYDYNLFLWVGDACDF